MGRRHSSVGPLGDGEHQLTFADGPATVSDVLVDAEGAHWRVRSLVSRAVLIYPEE